MRKSESYTFLDKLSLTCHFRCVEQLSKVFAKSWIGILGLSWAIFASDGALAARGESGSSTQYPMLNTSQFIEAEKLFEKRKWSEAIVAYRTILKTEPKSVPAILGLSASLTHFGKREEGLSLLVASANASKGEMRETLVRRAKVLSCLFLTNKTFQIYQEGLNLVLVGKYRNAKDRLEKALSEEPNNIEILTRLGQSLVLSEDFGGAIERLLMARKLNPFEPQVRLWLGRALYFKGSNTLAVSELKAAHLDLQNSEQAASWLAEAMFSSGQTNAAIRLLNADTKKWPFHILSLLTNAKFRLKMDSPDLQSLWSARKDLQLALSRLEHYLNLEMISKKNPLSMDTQKPASDLKAEIQKLLSQVQSKIDGRDLHSQFK